MAHPAATWRPTADLEALRLRARLYRLFRDFFDARGVLEVETPVLSAAANSDPNIRSFSLDYSGPAVGGARTRFLRTSPEFPLKRLLAAGIGDCYELGRVFRDGEAGGRHNPEFSMLEWYRIGFDHHRLMIEVGELLRACFAQVGRDLSVRTISYRELFIETFALDPFTAGIDALAAPLSRFSIDPQGLEREDWYDLLLTHVIEPAMPKDQILLLHGFPASQCALSRLEGEGVDTQACRFEAYVGGIELANGYFELTDADEQRQRFELDQARRQARGDPAQPLDEHLLSALGSGLPECAGVALGVDRLLMAMRGSARIDEVIAFPFARA